MSKFILGTKKYMTQIFDEAGEAIPGTIIEAGPVTVTGLKIKERDGYNAVQVGFGRRKAGRVNQSLVGQLKKSIKESDAYPRYLKEFKVDAEFLKSVKIGDIIDLSVFAPGDQVTVSGFSKGKGFQGVVKRHGFHGGPRSHGQKHSEREPGSIGSGGVQKVFKGLRMAGRMGYDRVTVKNLTVAGLNKETNELFIKGAVPGRSGTLLEIRAN